MLNSLRKLVAQTPDRAGTLMAMKTPQPDTGTGQAGTLRALSEQLQGVGAECADLRSENGGLTRRLKAANDGLQSLNDENGRLREALATRAQQDAETQALRDQLAAVGSENRDLKTYSTALAEQLNSVGFELQCSREATEKQRQLTKVFVTRLQYLQGRLKSAGEGVELGKLLDEVSAIATDAAPGTRAWKRTQTPAVLIAGLPKSASTFLVNAIHNGLAKPEVAGGLQGGVFPDFVICQEGFIRLQKERLISHTHLSPMRTNLLELGARFKLDRMIVHVRDPRQALLSWIHFVVPVIRDMDPVQAIHYGMPDDYLSRDFSRQADWQIEYWLPKLVYWMEGWMDAPSNPWFTTKIHYSTFERMKQDQKAFFDGILDFYEIERDLFDYPEQPKAPGHFNFRKGDVDEWRAVFSAEQVARVNNLVPSRLLDFFGWTR
jgi:hypothetical protein